MVDQAVDLAALEATEEVVAWAEEQVVHLVDQVDMVDQGE